MLSAMRATMPRGPAPAQRAPCGRCRPSPTASCPRACPQRCHPLRGTAHLRLLRSLLSGGGGGVAVLAALPAGARPLCDRDRLDAGADAHAACRRRPLYRPLRRPPRQHARAARRVRRIRAAGRRRVLLDLGILADLRCEHSLHAGLCRRAAAGGNHRAPHGLGRNPATAGCGSGARSPTCLRRRWAARCWRSPRCRRPS